MPRTPAPLDPVQLSAYFALMDVAGLLRHSVEQQLRDEGDLSYVQFQVLARLSLNSPTGSERMTDLADGLVYSRSGLTYQAGLLEKAGLVVRTPSVDDERSVTLAVTDEGRARIDRVLPGHVEVLRHQLFAVLTEKQVKDLGGLLSPVLAHMRAAPPRSAGSRRVR